MSLSICCQPAKTELFRLEELGAKEKAMQGGASGLVKSVSKKYRYLLEMSSLLFSAQARLTSYNDTYATDLAIQNPQPSLY